MDAYLGSIFSFAFRLGAEETNWVVCDGRTLNIAEYNALYALIGTRYGGNGVTTFGIPNLTGSVAVGSGQMPGGGNYVLAAHGGNSGVQIKLANIKSHTHTVKPVQIPVGGAATTTDPNNAYFGSVAAGTPTYAAAANGVMAANIVPSTYSGNQNPAPIDVRPPYVAVSYCICVNGIYPVRPN